MRENNGNPGGGYAGQQNKERGPVERCTPMAQKTALRLGIDIKSVSAQNGLRVTMADVKAAACNNAGAKAALGMLREKRREKLRGMRKVIAQRMSQSYFLYPTVTLTRDVDMLALLEFRKAYNAEHTGGKVTVTDMILAAVAKALRENEQINTRLDEEEIVYLDDINLGLAVALDNGLVVPVIRGADKLTLGELSQQTKQLAGAARTGTLTAEQMEGGTFSVTNLGSQGIDAFNPIINYPQSAILGVGRTVEKPVVLEGEIVIRPRAVLSLTHDHRVIDGVPAAAFLQSIVKYIEEPELL